MRDFTRAGAFTPELLTTLLLYMVADGNRRGYGHLLEGFWDEARSQGLELPTEQALSGPSFCRAREKITPALLKQILQTLASSELASDSLPEHRWNGRKIFAIDGSKVTLPPSEDLMNAFGTSADGHYPMALMSVLYDLGPGLPLDVEVSPYASSERDHLFEMLPSLEAGDVLIMDRGYPSHEVFRALADEGIDFLARVQTSNTFGVIEEMRDRGAVDESFVLEVPRLAPEGWKELQLRFVRVPGPEGDDAFFFTSLPADEYPLEMIAELYRRRWGIEEYYKLHKSDSRGRGMLRSKSVGGIVQEIYAVTLFLAISRLLMSATAKADERDLDTVSQKAAVLAAADYLARVLLEPDRDRRLEELIHLLRRISRVREKPRPGRSYPRRSLRPISKWVASGRRGR